MREPHVEAGGRGKENSKRSSGEERYRGTSLRDIGWKGTRSTLRTGEVDGPRVTAASPVAQGRIDVYQDC